MGFTFYKSGQGRYARGVTALGVGVILLVGCWELYSGLSDTGEEGLRPIFTLGNLQVTWGLLVTALVFVMGLAVIGLLTYGFHSRNTILERVGVRGRAFIDYMIDVEAELRKVAWPNRKDLFNSTWVVIITMVVFAIFLVCMDRILQLAMRTIGVL